MKFKLKSGQDVDLSIGQLADSYVLIDQGGNVVANVQKEDNLSSFICKDMDAIFEEDALLFQEKIDKLGHDYLNQMYEGVETDIDDLDSEEDPFNPQDISIDTKSITMDTILRRLEQKSIILNPDFQRSEVWDNGRKSRLIESLLLKIPIPMFYVARDEVGNLTVVDGLQRLSTIRDFVLGKEYYNDPIHNKDKKEIGLALTGLEFWKELEGSTMKQLPINLYNRIYETEFSFTIINPRTPEEVKRNIFKRINTGGMPLSSQEIRNALYGGRATKLLNKLVTLDLFKKATSYSIKSERMEDRELVLRLVSFLIRKPETYVRTTTADIWLSDTMIILNAMPYFNTKEYKRIKNRLVGGIDESELQIYTDEAIESKVGLALERAYQLFGNSAFRKSLPGHRRSPINQALFEVWGVLLSRMSEVHFSTLYENRTLFFEEYGTLLSQPEFIVAISRDSMRNTSVKSRYVNLAELINKYTND